MLKQRYPPLQPEIEELPTGTLGRRYADLILSLAYDPEFFRPRDGSSEGHWLTQRIATTHDIHPVITGVSGARSWGSTIRPTGGPTVSMVNWVHCHEPIREPLQPATAPAR